MTIHKEGYTSIALCILFIFVSNALVQFYLPQAHTFKWLVYIFSFLLFVAVIFFFRSSGVEVATDEKVVLSPVDGKITGIEEVYEPSALIPSGVKISIALSPLNTHVNLNPVSGTVKQAKNDSGTTIVVETGAGSTVVYRQIPGFTRHVVSYLKEGDKVEQGAKFGFGMLGSNVEVFLPTGTKTHVDINDVVKGGQTVLARLKS